MDVEITVRGKHREFHRPERATVHGRIGLEGPQPGPVYDRAGRLLRRVGDAVSPLVDPASGPVTWWSADQVRTSSHRPWNQDGKLMPLVHTAAATVEVKFSDFTVMMRWLDELAGETGWKVARVEWTLVKTHEQAITERVRRAAVEQARAKAKTYAAALGLGAVRPVAIADPGMLTEARAEGAGGQAAYTRAAGGPGGGEPAVELRPEDIEVSATVDARFVAG